MHLSRFLPWIQEHPEIITGLGVKITGLCMKNNCARVWLRRSWISAFVLKFFRENCSFNVCTASPHFAPPLSVNTPFSDKFCVCTSLCCAASTTLSFSPVFHSASLTLNWASHKWEIGQDYFDPCMFYLTHLLARISTHHCMLNSIKSNAIVIKGLLSQLLLAQILCALNPNRWRTTGARLNNHTQSPKDCWQTVFVFHIFSLHMSQGYGNPIPKSLLILSAPPQSPCLS